MSPQEPYAESRYRSPTIGNRQSEIGNLQSTPPLGQRLFPNKEWMLLIVLAVECIVFSVTGSNFLTEGMRLR